MLKGNSEGAIGLWPSLQGTSCLGRKWASRDWRWLSKGISQGILKALEGWTWYMQVPSILRS